MKSLEAHHDLIVELSKTNTMPEIAKILGTTYNKIRTYRNKHKINVLIRKGAINECSFKTLDDEPSAYFYGFLVTDGNLASGKRSAITLSLKDTDEHILQTFKNGWELPLI